MYIILCKAGWFFILTNIHVLLMHFYNNVIRWIFKMRSKVFHIFIYDNCLWEWVNKPFKLIPGDIIFYSLCQTAEKNSLFSLNSTSIYILINFITYLYTYCPHAYTTHIDTDDTRRHSNSLRKVKQQKKIAKLSPLSMEWQLYKILCIRKTM